MNNIVTNALTHGANKDLSIEIKLYHHDDFVCIDIKDNGQGIPEDKLPFIFERFYRIDSERTKAVTAQD